MATLRPFHRLLASRIIRPSLSSSIISPPVVLPLPHLSHSLRPLYPPPQQQQQQLQPLPQQYRFISLKAPRVICDEEIIKQEHLVANFVDHEAVFHGLVHVPPLLASIDQSQYRLVLINPGDGTPKNPAIIKQFTHEEVQKYELELAAREKALKETRKKQNQQSATKQIQFTWAISQHDLGIKMRKVGEMLNKGFRVEVMIAGKKGMMKVTREQAEDVVRIVDEEAEAKGGREWRDRQGQIGAQLVMYYEKGPRPKKKVEVAEGEVEGEIGGEVEGAGNAESRPDEQNIQSPPQQQPISYTS